MSAIPVSGKKERLMSDRFLRYFHLVALTWIGCAVLVFGLSYLAGGHASENVGNGPVASISVTLMLLATFGAPIFIIGALVCLVVAAVTYRETKTPS
jgi:hypothetical protein